MQFTATFWALVPPIVAIALALITKETYSSLFIGVVVGGLLYAGFNPVVTLDAVINEGLVPAIADNAGIFLFLVILGVMVALVNSTGASAAFGKWAGKHVKTKTGALLATFVPGVLIFIDDYFNCLTVGSVMRPITDEQKISRAKLAYLIDATAAPVCMIAPVSSWAAAVSGVANDLDAGISGIQLFIRAIPFNFYSLLTFVFVITLSIMGFDYGKMAKSELEAENGNIGALSEDGIADDKPAHTSMVKESMEKKAEPSASIWDMLIPVILLIILCVLGLIYVGGFFSADSGNAGNFIGAFGDTDAYVGLPWGSIVALVITIIYLICRKLITFEKAMACLNKGFVAMVPAIMILTLAVSLKNMTSLLEAATFVANVMEAASAGLYAMLPAIIFIVACLLAFATGTSWGTFGILIPIVLPIFSVESPLLMIGISACLAGAVCGDHCSPISDTTIMASAGANVNHIEHVSTQLPYAATVAGISFVCFVLAGFVQNAAICLIVGAALTVFTLWLLKKNLAASAPAEVSDAE